MKNNVCFISASETDREAVLKILEFAGERLTLSDEKVCAFMDAFNEEAEGDIYVADASQSEKFPRDKKLCTFSTAMSGGTVSAFNLQMREHSLSFEIMTGDFMGRAYLAKQSDYTMKQVLVAFTVLMAKGAKPSDILHYINEFTKEKD